MFKVGDKGVTVGGWVYEVTDVNGSQMTVRHTRKGQVLAAYMREDYQMGGSCSVISKHRLDGRLISQYEKPFARLLPAARSAACAPTSDDILAWLDRNHTLHYGVHALYVVDGYEVTITRDGDDVLGPFWGSTLREAYAAAMAMWDRKV